MPTASRLFSAIAFAVLGYAAAFLATGYVEEGVSVGWTKEIAAGVGLFFGWTMAGAQAPRSWGFGMAYGLNTSATMVIVTLVIVAATQMFQRSLMGRYGGPMEGLEAMIDIALGHVVLVLYPVVMAVLILGGLIAGMMAHAISRVWR